MLPLPSLLLPIPFLGRATYFNRLNLRVQPRLGTAVVFFPGFLNKVGAARIA